MKRSFFAAAFMTSRTRWGDSQKPRSSSGARPPSPQTREAAWKVNRPLIGVGKPGTGKTTV
eukprot:1736783-Alexandrium_andersonii.AAC.1